eukprot:348074-Prorocentrum_lima.AAC.1
MTSSLVGSEMCIRDRSWKKSSVSQRQVVDSPAQDLTASASRCSTTSAETVSYTHLTLPTICSV